MEENLELPKIGAGITKGIKAAFPQAYKADLATQRGDRAKLGTCTSAEIDQSGAPLIVVNAYTQFDWRGTRRAAFCCPIRIWK